MLVAIDTETTGLDLRHGCRPFFISTWWPEQIPTKALQCLHKAARYRKPTPRLPIETGVSEAPYSRILRHPTLSFPSIPLDHEDTPTDIHYLPSQHISFPEKGPRYPVLEGYGWNWLFPYDPYTRNVHPLPYQLEALKTALEGNSLILHNAYFDFLALANLGIYFSFEHPSFDTIELRNLAAVTPLVPPKVHIECRSFYDTQLACHTYDSKGPRGLKDAAYHYLQIPSTDEEELKKTCSSLSKWAKSRIPDWKYGKNLKNKTQTQYDYRLPITLWEHGYHIDSPFPTEDLDQDELAEVDPYLPIIYGSVDAYRTLALHYDLIDRLEAEDRLHHYEDQRYQLVPCYRMQSCGIALSDQHDELRAELRKNVFRRRKEILTLAAQAAPKLFKTKPFNPNSPSQAAQLFHDPQGFGYKPLSFTDKGEPSIKSGNRKVLAETLQDKKDQRSRKAYRLLELLTSWDNDDPAHFFPEPNTGYDAWTKSVGYLNSYGQHSLPSNTRWPSTNKPIHYVFPSFNPTGTDLTRYSSSNPNGQNIGKKSKVPLRKAFGPPPGRIWFAIDYSQLELRLFATACQDQALLTAFAEGRDFHELVACEIFQLPPDKIASTQRTAAKYINFGLIYGAGRNKIDSLAGFPGAYDRYCNNFSKVADYMNEVTDFASRNNYIRTLYGYPIHLGNHPPYKCVNYVIQGTAGQIVKYAMQDLNYQQPTPLDWDEVKLILNVHDELIFELRANQTRNYYEKILDGIMTIMANQGNRINAITPVDCAVIQYVWQEKQPLHDFLLTL